MFAEALNPSYPLCGKNRATIMSLRVTWKQTFQVIFRKTHLASLILDTKTSFSLRSRCYLFLIRRLASNYPINKMLRNVFKSSTLLSFHISSVVHRGSILVSAPLKCNASIIGHPLGGGGRPRANSMLNGDLYGDLND